MNLHSRLNFKLSYIKLYLYKRLTIIWIEENIVHVLKKNLIYNIMKMRIDFIYKKLKKERKDTYGKRWKNKTKR